MIKKAVFLISLMLFGTILIQSPALASGLGFAQEYNAFVFGDFTATGGGTFQGRLAAGGDISLTSYSVGTGLANDTSGNQNTLVAGGDLTIGWSYIFNGNAVAGGAIETPQNYNATPGSSFSEYTTDVIDWGAAENYLTGLSQDLSGLTATGSAEVRWTSNLFFSGDGTSDVQVFDVDGSSLAGVTDYKFENNTLNAPENATLIINVSGTTVSMHGGMWDFMNTLGESYDNVLFNFYEATALTLTGIVVQGSILAPLADINATGGAINGTVIASTFTSARRNLNNVPFDGTLDFDTPTTPVPEPGTLTLFSCGLLLFSGMFRKKKRA